MMMGPNVRRLMAYKMSLDAIPVGSGDKSFGVALDFLSDKKAIIEAAERAREWVEDAVKQIRNAAAPNPYSLRSDEEIAGMLLTIINKR